jgi:hypothetical protein
MTAPTHLYRQGKGQRLGLQLGAKWFDLVAQKVPKPTMTL